MENSAMTDEVKKQIKHSDKNVIYLSTEPEDNGGTQRKTGSIEIPPVGQVT